MDHTPKFKAGDLVRRKADRVVVGRIKAVIGGINYEFDRHDRDYPPLERYQGVALFDEQAELYRPPDRVEIHDIIGYDE